MTVLHDPDKETQKLIEALRGHSNPVRVYGEAVRELERVAWATRFNLRESEDHACVTRLSRKCNGLDCIQPPGIDHPSIWLYKGEPVVYVFQPYGLLSDVNMRLIEFCKGHSLCCDIDSHPAWHFPGSALHVRLYPRDGVYHHLLLGK